MSHVFIATLLAVIISKHDADWLINGIQRLSLEEIREEISQDLTRKTPDSFDLSTYKPYQGEPTAFLQKIRIRCERVKYFNKKLPTKNSESSRIRCSFAFSTMAIVCVPKLVVRTVVNAFLKEYSLFSERIKIF